MLPTNLKGIFVRPGLRASPGLPLAHQRPPCRARSAAPTAGRRGRPARWSTRRPRRGRAAAGWSSGGAGRWPWWASWAAAGGLPRGHYAGGCGCAPACLPSRAGCEHRARAVPGAPGHPRVSEASCVGCSMCGARAGSDGGDLARSRDLPAGDRARSHGVGTTHVFRVRRMPSVKDKRVRLPGEPGIVASRQRRPSRRVESRPLAGSQLPARPGPAGARAAVKGAPRGATSAGTAGS